jgi:hypothetical protein
MPKSTDHNHKLSPTTKMCRVHVHRYTVNIIASYAVYELGGGGAQGDGTPVFFYLFFFRTPTISLHKGTPR